MEVSEMIIYNQENEVIQCEYNQKTITSELLLDLFNKYVLKSKDFKKVIIKNNYDNTYTLKFYINNGYKTEYLIKKGV